MAYIIEDPANCSRNLPSDIFTGSRKVPSPIGLRLIHVTDLGNLKSKLYLIFKTSPRIDFIEAASIPAGGMTNSDQATEDLHA